MKGKSYKHIILLPIALVVLALAGCTRPDRNDEVIALSEEIINVGFDDISRALERVDSAEQAGLFTAVRANTVKAMIYENADQLPLATYYAKRAIEAESHMAANTPVDSGLYCVARWILADGAYSNGAYGQSIALAKQINAFVGDGSSTKDITMRCRALLQIAECESELNHIAEAERLFLQCVDILMECTQHATGYEDVDPLIYTLLSLNDLYVDNKMPKQALPLIAKTDTALLRLQRCCGDADWVLQMRRNNVMISQAIVYAANGQHKQAETLFRTHQQAPDLDEADKTAEGVYLAMTGRYDEAIRLYDEADSMKRACGEPFTDLYVKTLLKHKYDALQQAGRTDEALLLGDYMRQLTDSLRQQERQADVEQMQEIRRQEEEIAGKRQAIATQGIILIAVLLLLIMSGYIIWRVWRDNRLLAEKNRRLYEQIEQREQAHAAEQRSLQSQPEDSLTSEQQLYRRLCTLMAEQQPYTDENLNRDTLARLLYTNATYVAQAIHECSHGETVMDFITRYRLEHVAHLLKTTDKPISLIGELSGIPSRATLARLFRNAYGLSCSEYRQIAKQK